MDKILDIENEIIQIRREAGLEVIRLKREQSRAIEQEDQKAFDNWKNLEDVKLVYKSQTSISNLPSYRKLIIEEK